ncbi:MAG: DNA replication/repair protein RecF [Anaerolineae bacterium]|nr:DNA replication/repair protein RecF [Anaerolineae bacterium]
MLVRHLSLTNFRLYARLELDLPRGLVIVQGDNAQGKTSLLEAIYFLATGHSPHTHADRQVIRWGAEEDGPYPYAALRASVERDDSLRLIEMVLQLGEAGRLRKEIRIDRIARRGIDLVGQLNVVLFLPGDVELVAGAPALRRGFLDAALSQVDADYVRALDRYTHALAQRNALLKQAQERALDPDELAIWDDQLVPSGVEIALRRRQAVAELARLAAPIHRELSGGVEYLQITYQPNFDPARPGTLDAPYQVSIDDSRPPDGVDRRDLQMAFRRALDERRREEIARGMTLVGPHRDEVRFVANGMDLGDFGSRGQQRTAVLALKLAQVAWMRRRTGEEPVLLLDEVLAELDPHRRRCLLQQIGGAHQTIITTTDLQRLDHAFVREAVVLRVCGGVISAIA